MDDCLSGQRVEGPTRRELLQNPKAVFSGLAMLGTSLAAAVSGSDLGWSRSDLRVARRLVYGIGDFERAQLSAAGGVGGYITRQLRPTKVADGSVSMAQALAFPWLSRSATSLMRVEDHWELEMQLAGMTMYRAVASRRQLFERMVEFWCDHFHVSAEDVDPRYRVPYIMGIRKFAMGNFLDLLKFTANSPAMLQYLDNDANYGESPNQNYARELMELHTLGVDGGYTQRDVEQAALCLTGWTVEHDDSKRNYGLFKFESGAHASGNKTVLGTAIPSSGKREGDLLLAMLAQHPKTALFVCGKLIRWFHGPAPQPALLQQAAAMFLSSKGNIPKVLEVILRSPTLATAQPKLKRPFHLWASSARVLGITHVQTAQIAEALWDAGHFPFQWGPPNGYPDVASYWAGGLLNRINFAFSLATDGFDQVPMPTSRFVGNATESAANRVMAAVFAGEIPPEEAQRIRDRAQDVLTGGGSQADAVRAAIAFSVASPHFQWY